MTEQGVNMVGQGVDMIEQGVNMVGQRCGRGGAKQWAENVSSASASRFTRSAVNKL